MATQEEIDCWWAELAAIEAAAASKGLFFDPWKTTVYLKSNSSSTSVGQTFTDEEWAKKLSGKGFGGVFDTLAGRGKFGQREALGDPDYIGHKSNNAAIISYTCRG